MKDITIPPEAVEAAARAACEYYTSKEWSDINQGSKGVWRSAARAACLAMLKAWPRMDTGPNIYGRQNAIIHLPLPTENNDVEV